MQNGLGNWRRGENCSRKKEAELNLRLRTQYCRRGNE